MNKEVNFEIAKLLKEKGFDEKCSHYYINNFQNFKHDGKLYKASLPNDWDNENIFQFVKRINQPHLCNAPTIVEVVMWLYEKHGIWISVEEYKDHASDVNDPATYISNVERKEYKTPTECYTKAIEHVLNNLSWMQKKY